MSTTMSTKLIIFLLIFIKSFNCEKKLGAMSKIVGGTTTHIISYPYLVSIRQLFVFWEPVCGGSIVNNEWVLTAAHCTCSWTCVLPEKLQIHAGTTNPYDITTGALSTVSELITRNFIPENNMTNQWNLNDIALLRLAEPLEFGQKIKPMRLATPQLFENTPPWDTYKKPCQTAGWGLKHEEGPKHFVRKLRHVKLPLISNNCCSSYYENEMALHSTQICTYDKNNKKDVCFGDSGGPLVCEGVQIGIVSFSSGCAQFPNIWTRLDLYYDWITNVTDINPFTLKKSYSNGQMPNGAFLPTVLLLIFIVLLQ